MPQSTLRERIFHVYFMASQSGVLYLRATSNLSRCVAQHKEKFLPGFTQKYNVTKLPDPPPAVVFLGAGASNQLE